MHVGLFCCHHACALRSTKRLIPQQQVSDQCHQMYNIQFATTLFFSNDFCSHVSNFYSHFNTVFIPLCFFHSPIEKIAAVNRALCAASRTWTHMCTINETPKIAFTNRMMSVLPPHSHLSNAS